MEGLDKIIPVISDAGGAGIPGFGGGGGGSDTGAPLWQKLLLGGILGTGEVGNIIEERKRSQYQNILMNLIKNPALLTQMILKAQRPLDNALVQSVNNRVSADLASRGLSQAPGIFATAESQAIAPFVQQNYNEAMNQVLASLGLPGNTFRQPQNLSPLLQQFLRLFPSGRAPGPSSGSTSTGLTFPSSTDVGTPSGGGPYFGDPTLPDTGLGVAA